MTDEEFITAIRRMNVGILTEKALELVKRPATRAQQKAYQRMLAGRRAKHKLKRQAMKAVT